MTGKIKTHEQRIFYFEKITSRLSAFKTSTRAETIWPSDYPTLNLDKPIVRNKRGWRVRSNPQKH